MTFPSGLSAFPITPSDRDGRVDLAALRRLVARLSQARYPWQSFPPWHPPRFNRDRNLLIHLIGCQ